MRYTIETAHMLHILNIRGHF
ncbi:hypothetical protein Nmel_008326 [Mimus melanotis]